MNTELKRKSVNKQIQEDINYYRANPCKETFSRVLDKYKNFSNRPKCRICGGEIYYPNIKLGGVYRDELYIKEGTSFLSSKTMMDNKTYHLSVCFDCMCKEFGNEYLDKYKRSNKVFNTSNKFSEYAFNIPHEDIEQKKNDFCVRSLESYINKFGKEEGEKRWKHYCDLQAETNTFEYKNKKYGMTKEEFKEYNKSRACTLNNFIRRYGKEEGERRWDEYCKQEAYTNTKEYFIKIYGEQDGLEKWKKFDKARLHISGHSPISQDLFDRLSSLSQFKDNEIYYANKNTEYQIFDTSMGRNYYLDYYDKTLNICIEFNGTAFHPSTDKYNGNDIFKHPFSKKEMICQEIWNKEEQRYKYLKDVCNIDTIVVWENDYKKNHENATIELIANQINDIVNKREK